MAKTQTVVRELGKKWDVAIYGSGWGGKERGNTTYNFAGSYALTKNATITIGDNQWHGKGAFVSNRLLEALNVGGALMLHQHVPMLKEFTGFTPGEHYIEWTDHADMIAKAHYWLAPEREAERKQITANARAFVREHHTFDARVDELLNIILPEVLGKEV